MVALEGVTQTRRLQLFVTGVALGEYQPIKAFPRTVLIVPRVGIHITLALLVA